MFYRLNYRGTLNLIYLGVCTITIALPSTSDSYDAWEEWVDKFDQIRTHLSFRDALFEPRCDWRILVFIFRGHFVLDESCSNISWINKPSSLIHVQTFFIGQRSKGLKSENYKRMVSIFFIREYLFWFLYLPLFYAYGARLAQSVEMKFLAIESLRFSLKFNISVEREQRTVGLGPLMYLHHG